MAKFSSSRLRAARRAAGITLHHLRAKLTETLGDEAPAVSTLHRWERGEDYAPRIIWEHLARALGVAIEDFTTMPTIKRRQK